MLLRMNQNGAGLQEAAVGDTEVAVAVEWQGLPITAGMGWSGCHTGMEQSKPKTAEAKGCLGLRAAVCSVI